MREFYEFNEALNQLKWAMDSKEQSKIDECQVSFDIALGNLISKTLEDTVDGINENH